MRTEEMMKIIKKLILPIFALVMMLSLGITAFSDGIYNEAYAISASARLSNASTVIYTANLPAVPQSDDGMLYLYALQPYEYSVTATDVLVASQTASTNPTFSFSLNDMICQKFALCIKQGGKYQMIANGQYITNPEVAATHTRPLQAVGFVEPYEKMVLYRVGETDLAAVKRDNYSTAVIVNKIDNDLINPNARRGDSSPVGKKFYYAFNADNLIGVTKLRATMANFTQITNVDEFIIGNEVNQRCWNYTAYMDWNTYVREYAQAFRVSYNAIKSTNANAKVYISLDQYWNMSGGLGTSQYMDAADFLIAFNNVICSEGNIDWGVASHPYPWPMHYAKFWDTSGLGNAGKYVNDVQSGRILTFQNLPLLTSMMMMPGMLNPQGKIRSVILPEIGITSAQGTDTQAAAMMACYQAARNNPVINRIYYHRMNEGGIYNFSTSGNSEAVYQSLIAGNPGAYNAWALNYIGIADWRQIVMY